MNAAKIDLATADPMAGFSVFTRPPWLRARYACLTLIAHRRHVERLGEPEDGRLVVSTDWIAWRRALEHGHAAIHFEYALADWPRESPSPEDLFVIASRWMYVRDRDPTLFDGVSLGKQFTGFMIHVVRGHIRLSRGLDRLIETFRPGTIEFIDMRADVDALDLQARREIVRAAAARRNASLVERLDPVSREDPGLPELPYQRVPASEPAHRRIARRLYARAVECLFAGRRRRAGGVLPILNPRTVRNLVAAYEGGRTYPVLIADQMPKSARFLRECWRRGIALTGLPDGSLDRTERSRLAQIRAELPQLWSAEPADVLEQACRSAFLDAWDRGEVEKRASIAKSYRRLLDRNRIDRIVIGDAGNYTCHMLMELGKARNIGSDECLNGMFVTRTRHDARCGDGTRGPLVDRLLSWGQSNDDWLKASGAAMTSVRVGYPGLPPLRPQASRSGTVRRALVLPLALDVGDITASRSNVIFHLIDVVASLKRIGIAELRVKTHPARVNADYYREALASADLDCVVLSEGGLESHLEWADAVIGPANSGAWVETLAFGLPYYPMLPQPTSIDPSLCGGAKLYRDGQSIAADIAAGRKPDATRVLNALCSSGDIPDPARRFWHVMEVTV